MLIILPSGYSSAVSAPLNIEGARAKFVSDSVPSAKSNKHVKADENILEAVYGVADRTTFGYQAGIAKNYRMESSPSASQLIETQAHEEGTTRNRKSSQNRGWHSCCATNKEIVTKISCQLPVQANGVI